MATPAVPRPYRGSRVSTFYPVKSVPPLSALDSAFQLQEYISLLIRLDVHDVEAIVSLPGKAGHKDSDDLQPDISESDPKKTEDGERKSEPSVDRPCWIYEQLREAFQQAEAESSLYARFLKLTSMFDLVPAEFLVIPESAIQSDGKSQEDDVEPPRLLAAGIHPEQDIPRNKAEEQAHPAPRIEGHAQHPQHTEITSTIGTDSPRRIGRSRTDTMVFSEAHSIADELVKGEPGHDVESGGDVPVIEPGDSLQSPWTGEHSVMVSEETDDPHMAEDPRPTVPGSPPVEEVPLISLGELPAELPTTIPPPPDRTPPTLDAEEIPSVTVDTVTIVTPEENRDTETLLATNADAENQHPAVTDIPEAQDLQCPSPKEELDLPQIDSPQEPLPVSEPAAEKNSSQTQEAEVPEPAAAVAEIQEFKLDLSEPPPSEPVPPESDITDEAHAHDEQDEDGKE
ncbi:hypothetical protein ID866_4092 [Astraeus odoratus]|nr:hypothetical protein ID866_4092 [Astraeus odoratus]